MSIARQIWIRLPELLRKPIRNLARSAQAPKKKKNKNLQLYKPQKSGEFTISSSSHLDNIAILLHLGDGTQGSQHIYRQWRQTLNESNVPWIPVFRHKKIFEACRNDFPDDVLVYARRRVDIDVFLSYCQNLSTALHPGNTGNGCHLWSYDDIKQIFIGHGDSNKMGSSTRMFRVYDEVWVSGQAHVDRLHINSPNIKCIIVGRPQVKQLYETTTRLIDDNITATYLPTWEGATEKHNYSSIDMAALIMSLMNKYNIKLNIKLHPNTGARRKEYRTLDEDLANVCLQNTTIFPRINSAIDLMSHADFCITDTSSIVSDWLSTKRPIFIYYPHAERSKTELSVFDYAYVFSNIEDLENLLIEVIKQGNDYKKEIRNSASEYLVSSESTKSDYFANLLKLEIEKKDK